MAQVEQYTTTDQHHHTDENHPGLSSVPSLPGPELDSKHYQHQKELPEPPLFSPPITNTSFDDTSFDRPEDLSIESIQSHSSLAEFNDKSHEDHSGSINEPRTPESIAPSLDYVPFITSQSDSLSVDQLNHPPEIISKAQAPQEDEEVEEETSHEDLHDHSFASASQKPESQHQKSLESEQIHPQSISPSVEENAKAESEQLPVAAVNAPPKAIHRQVSKSKHLSSGSQTKSMSADEWLDITRTEFQFAIGLFAIPWSSLIILTRSINLFWTLIFTQPLVQPITGIMLSIIAPSILYTSLLALLISSAAHIHS
ncbi:hypothetical protein PGT21_008856 [Puccinia graminis f. sp. tritici]|uniref:Uncharacterized protein n=2 Tax=Puccinia graminis f. sp. tritici TaxID=56615 RepID=E3K9C8_PUCGT|nr:uncharacterized protein PGTG_07315 [Puccinia graminis f. sp. tritici CRL 75-36-700-3]EFP81063.1 hypothetical protein PGTG_07315 [Puccinia graminis f. sp. tritici CRL 75-36-700-3]KAA1069007.1 hypothetical protein PGT21_008856 [Puccinia graminis f. sp. tritici]